MPKMKTHRGAAKSKERYREYWNEKSGSQAYVCLYGE